MAKKQAKKVTEVEVAMKQAEALESQVDLASIELHLKSAIHYGIDLVSRVLVFDSGIEDSCFHWLSAGMACLEAKGDEDITLDICSVGGSVSQALAILGRIRSSPCKVHVRVFGSCCSAATILLAGATGKRQISEFASFMHHEASWEYGARQSGHKDILLLMEKEQKRWAAWLERFTKKPANYWLKLEESGKDHWFVPEECVALGVADEVI
jgi:ATP-dependent protease ClpP protease subunit